MNVYQVYRDRLGIEYKIIPGELSDNANHLFLYGQCHALACAIHEKTSWPLVLLVSKDLEDDEMLAECHVSVLMPDGNYLDIQGIQSEDVICSTYDDDMAYIEFEQFNNSDELIQRLNESVFPWTEPELQLAQSMVEPLFEKYQLDFPAPPLQAIDSSYQLKAGIDPKIDLNIGFDR